MNKIKCFVLGFKDGWTQPREVSTSANVYHLGSHYEVLDNGINWGQRVRRLLILRDRNWDY